MASSPRILCLNLGMQTISIADFRKNPDGGLTLHDHHTTELIVDPGADATRNGQIKMALTELRGQLKLRRNEKIHYALPSQAVFTRFVKLPEAPQDKIEQIIGFEAQQNVPFPIDEVVWDYQILGKASEGKMDVVLVAIKADQLAGINEAVEEPGLTAGVIDVSQMALYNAFRFNYSEQTGCSLIIDIGARTTNLIFVENERVFSRGIPIGGSTISAALAKEFNMELAVGEELKKTKGFVGLGGAYADPDDPAVAKISKLIRNTFTRLHAEIARSISFYRSNHHGSQPVRTYLAGGTVSFSYMREFFNEKLQMPIEFFNPLRNIVVAPSADVDSLSKNAHMMGELVGLATRELQSPPIALNLRPPNVVFAQEMAKKKPYLLAAAACLFCAMGLWSLYFYQVAEIKRTTLNSVRAEHNNLEQFAGQFVALAAEQKKLQDLSAPLMLAVAERSFWASVIDELGAKLPPRFIWITRVTPLTGGAPVTMLSTTADGQKTQTSPKSAPPAAAAAKSAQIDAIEIRGLYLANPKSATVVDDFVQNLSKSDKFTITEQNKGTIVHQRSTPDGETWAYAYTLVLPLKQPISL